MPDAEYDALRVSRPGMAVDPHGLSRFSIWARTERARSHQIGHHRTDWQRASGTGDHCGVRARMRIAICRASVHLAST